MNKNAVKILVATCISLLATAQLMKAQPPAAYPNGTPVNYIRTWDATAPISDPNALQTKPLQDVKQATQYFDGLGRPLQTVVKQGSLETGGSATDLVSPVVYDEFGREQYKYLPFAANSTGGNSSISDGNFKLNPFQQQATFMTAQYGAQGETFFYSKTNFEASPLNRVEKAMAPGNSWAGSNRGVEMKYWLNTTPDMVKIWTVNNNPVIGEFGTYQLHPSGNVNYPAGQLFKTVSVDEHGKQVIEFKDSEGKVILKRMQLTGTADDGTGSNPSADGAAWLSTYYVYDDMDNLRCVIQPEGVKWLSGNGWTMPVGWPGVGDLLGEQCFRYEYDQRKRLIVKKVPGAGEVYMVYDARDRLVLMQDANMRQQGKWMLTKYDMLNRPVETGLVTNASTFSSHLSAAYSSTNYIPAGAYEELSKTFYDDYTWLAAYGSPLPNTYNTAHNSYFQTASNTNWPYAQANVQSNLLKGMATGTRIKVLGSSTYLYTVSFYDDKGRPIQIQSTNISGGTDIITTQYTWAGQPLVTVQQQQKAGGGAQTSIVVSQLTYDELGRLVKTEKKQSNTLVNSNAMSSYKTIAQHEYDKLGQLKKKSLGTNAVASGPLETLNYDYNIRGWMLGMNRDYAKDLTTTNYFGFDLGYDKQANGLIGGATYTATQYNGNITGMVWKSKGDGEKRKYDFTYDAANRILSADFNQYSGGAFNKTAGIDFSMSNMSYDANGNILSMHQKGWKITGSSFIDQLTYNYLPNSNKLLNVTDAVNDAQTKLGDFRTSALSPNQVKTNTTVDYTYDANGNLKKDLNKDIGTATAEDIIYNHLNLPQSITVRTTGGAVKGTISYTYDAAGNKLQKTVAETGQPTKTTLYIGGAVYENDALQFMGHEEGRIRVTLPPGGTGWAYDYMLKDHLGNVRMLLTEEQKQDVYPAATLENVTYNGGTAISVEDDYYTVNAANVVNQSTATGIPVYQNNNGNPPYNNNPHSNYTANSTKLYVLNATTNTMANKTGLGIVLKVMAGDAVNIFGKSYHKKPAAGYSGTTNSIAVLDLINAFVGTGVVAGKGITGAQVTGQPGFPTAMSGLIGSQPAQNTNLPKAAINWIVLDEQFKYVSGGFDMVGTATNTNGTFKNHNNSTIPTINVQKNGYIYVWASNESKFNVFFDNLQLIHTRGPVLEETHYYPFGLTMSGISSKAAGMVENRKKFNGIEFDDDLDINIYEAFFRNLDPQIGRWWQIDPEVEGQDSESPYSSMANDPILRTDPLGDIAENSQEYSQVESESGESLDNCCPGAETIVQGASQVSTQLGPIGKPIVVGGLIIAGLVALGELTLDNLPALPAPDGNAFIPLSAQIAIAKQHKRDAAAAAATRGPGATTGGAAAAAKALANGTTGSYTNTHKSGKTYSGKGPQKRASESANRIAKAKKDPLKKTEWKPAKNDREAFKAEDKRIKNKGGAGNTKKNYNKINSPGKKYNEQDKKKGQ